MIKGFKYVCLKVNKIIGAKENQEKLLVQVIDISDKILYNEIKAE